MYEKKLIARQNAAAAPYADQEILGTSETSKTVKQQITPLDADYRRLNQHK